MLFNKTLLCGEKMREGALKKSARSQITESIYGHLKRCQEGPDLIEGPRVFCIHPLA